MAKKIICGITVTWKKLIGVIAGLLGIGTLTSCYGMPVTTDVYHTPDGSSNVILEGIVKDQNGNGVPGIRVSSNYSVTKTKENGYFEVLAFYPKGESTTTVTFADIDGTENGNFETKETISVMPEGFEDIGYYYDDEYDDDMLVDLGTIVLEEKK